MEIAHWYGGKCNGILRIAESEIITTLSWHEEQQPAGNGRLYRR